MTPEHGNWISIAYQSAELAVAKRSAKEIARMEKCGCGQCSAQVKHEYELWEKWGKFNPNTRQNKSKALMVIKKEG